MNSNFGFCGNEHKLKYDSKKDEVYCAECESCGIILCEICECETATIKDIYDSFVCQECYDEAMNDGHYSKMD